MKTISILMSMLLVGFIVTSKASQEEYSDPYKVSGLISTSVWDKYLLFQVPTVISDQPSLQFLLVVNLPHGFTVSTWVAQDLGGTSGDETDLNLGWGGQVYDFNISLGVGAWNVDPLDSGWDDILTGHLNISKQFLVWDNVVTSWYVEPRFYHTSQSFLGQGWNISAGFNATVPVTEEISLAVNPFMSYDDGFGVKSGMYFGTNLTVNLELNETTSLFFSTRGITGQGNSEIAGGAGISVKF